MVPYTVYCFILYCVLYGTVCRLQQLDLVAIAYSYCSQDTVSYSTLLKRYGTTQRIQPTLLLQPTLASFCFLALAVINTVIQGIIYFAEFVDGIKIYYYWTTYNSISDNLSCSPITCLQIYLTFTSCCGSPSGNSQQCCHIEYCMILLHNAYIYINLTSCSLLLGSNIVLLGD